METYSYHVQVCKTKKNNDGSRSTIRGLGSEAKYFVVQAEDITAAIEAAEKEMMSWPGEKNKSGRNMDWFIDGHPSRRGSTIGEMIG